MRGDRVPQMADAEEVVARVERRAGVELSGLVLNEKGWERFAAAGPRPRQRHVRGDGDLQRAERQRDARRGGRAHRGDPRGGGGDARDRDGLVRVRLSRSRAASIPVSSPSSSRRSRAARRSSSRTRSASRLRRRCARSSSGRGAAGFHGHNTRNTGYANCLAALEAGATVLDASIGGLGGCPFSPRATGNVATEDLVWLLERRGRRDGHRPRCARRDLAVAGGRARTDARGLRLPRLALATRARSFLVTLCY